MGGKPLFNSCNNLLLILFFCTLPKRFGSCALSLLSTMVLTLVVTLLKRWYAILRLR